MKEFLSKTRHLFIEKAKLYQLIILTKTGGTSVHAEYISLSREQKRSAIKRGGRMIELKPCPHCGQMTEHSMPICMVCGRPISKPIINQDDHEYAEPIEAWNKRAGG